LGGWASQPAQRTQVGSGLGSWRQRGRSRTPRAAGTETAFAVRWSWPLRDAKPREERHTHTHMHTSEHRSHSDARPGCTKACPEGRGRTPPTATHPHCSRLVSCGSWCTWGRWQQPGRSKSGPCCPRQPPCPTGTCRSQTHSPAGSPSPRLRRSTMTHRTLHQRLPPPRLHACKHPPNLCPAHQRKRGATMRRTQHESRLQSSSK
jgi:hypothetical protein